MQGKLITLEGPDGSGKSTNLPYLAELLKSKGYLVDCTREPGGTLVGEKIRDLLLSEQMTPMAELLLFAAARAEHIETFIKPALAAGYIVLCDRFADSTYAYQGVGRGYNNSVLALETMVHAGFEPDHTLFFDVTLEESQKRLAGRAGQPDHFDLANDAFKTKVYQGYQTRFKQNSHRMHRINAMLSPEWVRIQIKDWVNLRFVPANPLTKEV